jgi:hypothetical protein
MVITTTDIQLFQILKQKLGEQEAEALVTFVDAKLKEANEQNLKVVATKEDIAILRTEIAASKTDTIKWLVTLFITLALMIIGLYFKK